MKNSDLFFDNAFSFQNERKAIIDDYEQTMEKIKSAKGSQYYTDEAKKAADKRDSSLGAIKAKYGDSMRFALKKMLEANGKRAIKPPTADELAILQALKMRETITTQELAEAAQALKGNKLCLSVLQEVAHKNGIIGHNFMAMSDDNEMFVGTAEEIIKGVASELSDFLEHDTAKAARIVANHSANMYGNPIDESSLRKRSLFETKKECFSQLFGLNDYDAYESFLDAVDGKEA